MKKHGISLRIHPAGGAALAASFVLLDTRKALASFLALTLHEMGHLLVMRLCGICDCTVELTPFGGIADAKMFEYQAPAKRMLCAFAGVAASTFAALVCFFLAPRTIFWHMFFESNMLLAVLNSLPAWPLDGARVLAALAGKLHFESTARKILKFLTVLLGGSMIALGLFGIWHGFFNISLLLTGPYLWYAAGTEEVSVRMRRLNPTSDKLSKSEMQPALVWVGDTETNSQKFSILLGRMQQDHYHLFVQIDPETGRIQKIWSESEMRLHALSDCQK